jgi:excinuclease ABC subunit B
MQAAIDETDRRRAVQQAYNEAHGITPQTIRKKVKEIIETTKVAETPGEYRTERIKAMSRSETLELIGKLEKEMRQASKVLEFERAAELRDMIVELRLGLQNAPPVYKEKKKRG